MKKETTEKVFLSKSEYKKLINKISKMEGKVTDLIENVQNLEKETTKLFWEVSSFPVL